MQPIAQEPIHNKLLKRIEKDFDELWYHLYRAVSETQQIRSTSSQKKKTRQENLADFAKKALHLYQGKKDTVAEDKNEETKVEGRLKRGDNALKNIVFIDKPIINQNRQKCKAPGESKYKEKVMVKLNIRDNNFDECCFLSRQPQSPNFVVEGVNAERKTSEAKPVFLTQVKERIGSANSGLFTEDFAANLASYMTMSGMTSPMQRKGVNRNIVVTPFTAHAKSVLRHSPKMEPNQKLELRKKTILKFLSEIYGKKRQISPLGTVIGSVTRCQTAGQFQSGTRPYTIQGTTTTRNSPRRTAKTAWIGARSGSVAEEQKRDRPHTRHRRISCDKLDNIINGCLEEQVRSEGVLADMEKYQKDLNGNLNYMATALTNPTEIQKNVEEENRRREIISKKHLFIYGKSKRGRFMNEKCKDLIKVSDLLVTVNPKYKFMLGKLQNAFTK